MNKHDYRVILKDDNGTLKKAWEFMGITAHEFQVELSGLIDKGSLPKESFKHWYKTGVVSIEKDGVLATIGE